jgi:hypothetical protein
MSAPITIIMLAGSLRPPLFREQIGIPRLCLPLDSRTTVLGRWSRAFATMPGKRDIKIVLNSDTAAGQVDAFLALDREISATHVSMRVIVEPTAWRGPAGIIADVTSDVPPDGLVVAVEANGVAPASLAPLLEPLERGEADGVIGSAPDGAPNGLCALRRRLFEVAPAVGYFDLKEQMLPAINRAGSRIVPVAFDDPCIRIRDRRSYLGAVRHCVGAPSRVRSDAKFPAARIEARVRLFGSCVIEGSASVESEAVVHDSVVMRGARVGAGAVVSRSVIAPGATVENGRRVVREVVPANFASIPFRIEEAAAEAQRRRRLA